MHTNRRGAGICDSASYTWRHQYGGMSRSQLLELHSLENENTRRRPLYHKDRSIILIRPKYPNHVWNVDFAQVKLGNGQACKRIKSSLRGA